MELESKRLHHASPFRVVLPYLVISITWILFSDRILFMFTQDAAILSLIQTYKGLGFVSVTALLLYFLSKSNIRIINKNYRDKTEQDKIYKALLEHSTDLTLLTDETGRVKYAPGNTAGILGYDQTELVGLNLNDVIHPDDQEKFRHFLSRLNASNSKVMDIEYRALHKDGHYVWVESFFANHIADPVIGSIVCNTRDVTARVHAEESLHQNELLFRSVFEQAVIGLAIIHIEKGKKIVNDKFCELTGYTRDELLSLDPSLLIVTQDRERYKEVRARVEKGESDGYEVECRMLRKDGSTFWANQNMHVIRDLNNQRIYFSVITRDINDKKTADAALQYKNKELDTFLYRSSHDLRGPIATLLGLVDVARQEIPDPRAHIYFNFFHDVAYQLEKVLANLMAVTQIKQNEVFVQPVNVLQLVKTLVHKNKILSEKNAGQIQFNIETGFYMRSDESLLKTIFNSVLENAVIFRKNCEIPNTITVSAIATHNQVLISIRDNGIGIPLDEQDKVFDLFFRGKNTERGSGIGLYVAKCAVDKLGGRISLESVPTLGTEVHITLPR